MKLEVDDEALDGLIVSALTQSIGYIEKEIKELRKVKNRKPHQQADLSDHLEYIDALKKTRYYFGGYKYDPNK